MSTVKVIGLQVIALYVSDLQVSSDFYLNTLGFEESDMKMDPGLILTAGELILYLEQVERKSQIEHMVDSEVSPCFAVESVKSAHDSLSEAGVPITTPYVEFAPTFALFRIEDPDGNLIEFAGAP